MSRKLVSGLVLGAVLAGTVVGVVTTQSNPTSSEGTTTGSVTLTNLSLGTHKFEVRACDPAGNCDPTPASVTWTVVRATASSPAVGGSLDANWLFTIKVVPPEGMREVRFYFNDKLRKTDTTEPYSSSVPVESRTQAFKFKATALQLDGDSSSATIRFTP